MRSHRRKRQGTILRLIRDRPISTQQELAAALREERYDVVQRRPSLRARASPEPSFAMGSGGSRWKEQHERCPRPRGHVR